MRSRILSLCLLSLCLAAFPACMLDFDSLGEDAGAGASSDANASDAATPGPADAASPEPVPDGAVADASASLDASESPDAAPAAADAAQNPADDAGSAPDSGSLASDAGSPSADAGVTTPDASSGSIADAGACTPNCSGKNCGSDGCGGSCGSLGGDCPANFTCTGGGLCSCNTFPCGSACCGPSQYCAGTTCKDCSTCAAPNRCDSYQCKFCGTAQMVCSQRGLACGNFDTQDLCSLPINVDCPAFSGTTCVNGVARESTCTDSLDNDSDGAPDLADEDCWCSSPGSVSQVFKNPQGVIQMVGCKGSVTWPDRNSLCSSRTTACAPRQVLARRGSTVPSYHYWTSDALGFNESAGCVVAPRSRSGLTIDLAACAGEPLRVCPYAGQDGAGNSCGTRAACKLDGDASNTPIFGGCSPSVAPDTASTLCCPDLNPAFVCLNGSDPEQDFGNNYMFGCVAQTNYASAANTCAAGCQVCSAADWRGRPDGATPDYDYWLSDCITAPAGLNNNCVAGLPADCAASTWAHVCASSQPSSCTNAPYGCGLGNPSPNEYLGGYGGDAVGPLCCCP